MSDLADQYPEIVWKIYWTKGYETGVQAERERILKVLKQKAAARTILPTVAAFFHIDELIETIREGQYDA
jgi:hypothetical protein